MKMTFARYRRLLLVVLAPLLIGGAIFSYYTSPFRSGNFITCDNSYGEDFCRNVGGFDSPLLSVVRKNQESWFDIIERSGSESGFLSIYVEGSQRLLKEVTIPSTTLLYKNPDEVPYYIKNLQGKSGAIILGISDPSQRSLVTANKFLLYCNRLSLESGNDYYQSFCFGDGWNGLIEYSVTGETKDMLSALSSSISEAKAKLKKELILYWVITTPIFLVVFVFISLVIFSLKKAYIYVKGEHVLPT